ncbi:MAG: hypothetical protein WAL25_09180 [Acidimicrobiia bacterium]
MVDPGAEQEHPFPDWDDGVEDVDDGPGRSWRGPLLIAVAALTAVAVALVPLYNLFRQPQVADNGLEVCGFDYCIVTEAVTAAGLDLVMSRLANMVLDETEAREMARELTDYLEIDPVALDVVGDLEGRLGGVFDPETRSILIESPARAWTVLHEVAHAEANGHDERFQRVVVDLAQQVGG